MVNVALFLLSVHTFVFFQSPPPQDVILDIDIDGIPIDKINLIQSKFEENQIDDKSSTGVGPMMNALYTLVYGIITVIYVKGGHCLFVFKFLKNPF